MCLLFFGNIYLKGKIAERKDKYKAKAREHKIEKENLPSIGSLLPWPQLARGWAS